MFRPGTKAAQSLLLSTSDEDWTAALQKYDAAIQFCAETKNNTDLIDLDLWWRNEYVKLLHERDPKYLDEKDLQKVMRWKISRGKDRPMLMGLLRQNSWNAAMTALMALKGVGPATASAILAPLDPINCPFMADEVLESTTNKKREYTFKAYEKMRSILCQKSSKMSTNWSPELLGRALWAQAIASLDTESSAKTALDVKPSHDEGAQSGDADTSVTPTNSRKRRRINK